MRTKNYVIITWLFFFLILSVSVMAYETRVTFKNGASHIWGAKLQNYSMEGVSQVWFVRGQNFIGYFQPLNKTSGMILLNVDKIDVETWNFDSVMKHELRHAYCWKKSKDLTHTSSCFKGGEAK